MREHDIYMKMKTMTSEQTETLRSDVITFSLEWDKQTANYEDDEKKIQISLWLFFNCKLKCWSCWFETKEIIIITPQYACVFHLILKIISLFFLFLFSGSFCHILLWLTSLASSFSSCSLSRQMQRAATAAAVAAPSDFFANTWYGSWWPGRAVALSLSLLLSHGVGMRLCVCVSLWVSLAA